VVVFIGVGLFIDLGILDYCGLGLVFWMLMIY